MYDWWHRIWGGVSKTVEHIWSAIKWAIGVIVDWAMDLFEDIVDAADNAWDWIVRAFREIENAVNWILDHVIDPIWTKMREIIWWAQDLVAGAINYARQSIELALDWVVDRINEVRAAIRDATEWIVDHVISPIWNKMREIIHWVEDQVDWLIDHVIAPIWRKITEVWNDLLDRFRDVWDWLAHNVGEWLRLLDRYKDRLVEFLRDPIGWFAKRIEDLMSRSARWFTEQILAAISSNTNVVEDLIARWLKI